MTHSLAKTTPAEWLSELRKEWKDITGQPWHFFPWEDSLVQESLMRSGNEFQRFAPLMPGDDEVIANGILCASAIRSAQSISEHHDDIRGLFQKYGPEGSARNHSILAMAARYPEVFDLPK